MPSVSAKLAQTGGLKMNVLGLKMNFNQCFYLCSKASENLLVLSPQGSVAQILFFFFLC